MSDIARDALDIREQIARIDRTQAEMQKLNAETQKFVAEQSKLSAEAGKFNRDRYLAPILTAAAVGGVVSAIVPTLLRAWGILN